MNKTIIFCFSFFYLGIILSCSSDTDPDNPPPASGKQITSYIIEAAQNGIAKDILGEINQDAKTITLNSRVPVDKDLIATFEAVGNVYIGLTKQVSGKTSNNLCSGDIQYKVVADDGSSIAYNLIATPDNEGEAINNYRLTIKQNGEETAITGKYNDNETVITLEIPKNDWIENIEKAVATFECEGNVFIEDKEQQSGVTSNDFRKELTYTVTKEGKSPRKYKVVVISPQSTGLPVIKIDTDGGAEIKDKETYIGADFSLTDAANPINNIDNRTGIRGRGNSTWLMYPKKPYRLKFDQKASLFGLGEAKSWVLRANYQDPTFIMNTVAFELGQRLGLQFTNHAHHVELFLNGKYKGSYLLTEQVQVNEYRVNVDENTGFLIEFDTNYDEEMKFRSPKLDLPVNIKSPEVKNEAEIEFVKQTVIGLENALFDTQFPSTNYQDIIDINSVINYLLVNEIVGNAELWHPKSVFAYKNTTGKIHMGPIWDFDWGFSYSGEGFTYFQRTNERLYDANPGGASGDILFARFFEDPQFRQAYKDRWNEIKNQIADIEDFMSAYGTYLQKSAKENEEEWNNGMNYTEQIENMRKWYRERLEFLDKSINAD